MTHFKNDRRAMGAGAALILVVLLVVIGFVVATAGMPYFGKQNIVAGDTLTYEFTSTTDPSLKSEIFLFVTDVGTNTLSYTYFTTNSEGVTTNTETVGYRYEGNVLMANISFFIFFPVFLAPENLINYESTYWFSLSGLTPMLVQKYSGTEDGVPFTVMMKMGTNLVVAYELTFGNETLRMVLKDSSMPWVKII